jgi:drug/metabolite transporter (DMT)-like permease
VAQQRDWRVPLALFSLYFIWGSTYFAIRIAIQTLPPFSMAAFRFLVAGALLLAFLRFRGEPLPTAKQWLNGAKIGGLLLCVGNGGVVFAQQWIASGLAAVLIATTSLWTSVFAGLFGQWPTGRQWVGIGLGLLGVAVLNYDADLRATPFAVVLILLAATSWAFGSVWGRRLDLPKGMMGSAVQMIGGGSLLAVVALVRQESLPSSVSLSSGLAVAYLVLFGSLMGFTAYQFLLGRASPTVATSYCYVNPIVAVLLGVGLGSEKIGPHVLGALALILSGVALVAIWPASKPAAPATSPRATEGT